MRRRGTLIVLFVILLGFSGIQVFGANSSYLQMDKLRSVAPKVFLDCSRSICDLNYIRTEITFVNYVLDRESADIHIIVTRQRTGSGGFEFNLDFIGRGRYVGRDSSLKFFSKATDTEDEIRKGMVKVLKQGLIPYVSDTPLAEHISVTYEGQPQSRPSMISDPWNYWVFSVGLRGDADVEELSKQYSGSLSFSVNRTTEEMKFRFWANANFSENKYNVEDEGEIISRSTRKILFSQYVKGVGGNWAAGIFIRVFSSTYDNANVFTGLGPAIEYNIFPYEQANRRELRIQYRLDYNFRDYIEVTIFDKLQEHLFRQELQVIFELKEPWGSAGLRLEGSHFLHDFSKNNIRAEAGISMRVFKGFSFNIEGSYSQIRDQLALPRRGASKEEVLLELKQLATSYNFRLEVGFNYRFGSIFSNVVNPRFGNR